MRIPERTILAISALFMSISSLQGLRFALQGGIEAHMQAMASQASSPENFRIGYITGFTIVMGIKVLASLGLWALLVKRWKRPSGQD